LNVSHETFIARIERGVPSATPYQLALLEKYSRLLVQVALPMGLIGSDPKEVFTHILRALALLDLFPALTKPPIHLVDVGSGAGLPGIALSIVRGQGTMVEPKRKAVAFLEKVKRDLDLEIEVLALSAEQAYRSGYGEVADIVTARALAPGNKALELCGPLCREGGTVLLTSAPADMDAGIEPLRRPPGFEEPIAVTVGSSLEIEQRVTIVRKTSPSIPD
jgi:16S rRNA (guanine527-N7)-methyltransferase